VSLIVFLTNLSMIILGIFSCFKSEIFNQLMILFLEVLVEIILNGSRYVVTARLVIKSLIMVVKK